MEENFKNYFDLSTGTVPVVIQEFQ